MNSLGLAVITFNEEKHIKKVLESVPFASQKVVVDSLSEDNTVAIAKACGAEVISHEWQGYSKQKQFCLDQMKTDWVLVLDGDEWLSESLANEIHQLLSSGPSFNGYFLTRHLVFLNRTLVYGRGKDHQLRLFKNGLGRYNDRDIHEEILVEGPLGKLVQPIIHHSSQTISDEISKLERDTSFELEYYQGHSNYLVNLIFRPIYFWFVMLIKGTWKDGIPGLIFLTMTSYKYFILAAKKYEKDISNKK